MKWTLQQIAEWTQARVLSQAATEFNEVGTDSRQDLTGKVFVALKGENFDAHEYLNQAVEKGAAALLVHQLKPEFENLKNKVTILMVSDTLKALQDFASGYRNTLNCKVIGITGSNGKTTTKEFTAAVLSQFQKTHYSQGSFNNHWGVPLTLLGIPKDTKFAVVEMGMNNYGEIARLVQIAKPNIVVCTMIGTAHIEFFGTKENIAKSKSEIYMESDENTIRIFNQDQDLTFDMMYPVAKKFPASRMLTFSQKNNEADVFFKIDQLTMRHLQISGFIAGVRGEALVSVFGRQNLTNLMAAATIAFACEVPPDKIWKALTKCVTSWGRNQFIATEVGAEILFDGYNANPDSMLALLENLTLLTVTGKKIGIFGQMKEQGAAAPQAHREIGLRAGQAGLSQIYFVGEDHSYFNEGLDMAGYSGPRFTAPDLKEEMLEHLAKSVSSGDIILIKGSRGAKTERFIPACRPINWAGKV
jgi:UDP-N-acetylmuramoyl-tripeptide--D-alanyl-D-alanine ligase